MSNANPVSEASPGDVAVVISAGAIGGFLSVAGALTQPEVWTAFGPPTWFRYVILPLMLGGLAGAVAVFVLTHFDSANKLRMFFFAAVREASSECVPAKSDRGAAGDRSAARCGRKTERHRRQCDQCRRVRHSCAGRYRARRHQHQVWR